MNSDFLRRLEERLAAEEQRPLPIPLRAALAALAAVYHGLFLLDRLPYRTGWRRPVHPGVPVVGLGNLVAGGTGKTPCAIWLANSLRRSGLRPAVISHGYKATTERAVVVSTGGETGSPPVGAGDEARLVALSCPGVPVVAARDRVAGAGLARKLFAPSVLIVDDAFQHWRLGRDLDLVLLDAARPFGNGHLLPRGWLREPVGALSRAGAVILAGTGPRPDGLPAALPLFRAALRPATLTRWEEWRRGVRQPLGTVQGQVAAFCGLARPERFRRTLASLGWSIADQLDLADHDLPTVHVLSHWAARTSCPIVTTEKDAVKLRDDLARILTTGGRELWVLGVEFVPAVEEDLLAFVLAGLDAAMTTARE